MDLLDRYLQAVKFFLPRAQQDDIIKELSEDVHSRLDDLQAELGRPPNAAEQEALIKSYGHPALLAGRYGPRRQLVGPEMFPFYWFVLRLASSTAILVHVIVAPRCSRAARRLSLPSRASQPGAGAPSSCSEWSRSSSPCSTDTGRDGTPSIAGIHTVCRRLSRSHRDGRDRCLSW
jgi:hypothetical protein